MKDLIVPAKVNTDVIQEYVDQMREKLDNIEESLIVNKESPGRILYHFLHNVSEIRDLSALSTRKWAIQWHQSGAKVATIARAVRMSWSGVSKWITDEDVVPENGS